MRGRAGRTVRVVVGSAGVVGGLALLGAVNGSGWMSPAAVPAQEPPPRARHPPAAVLSMLREEVLLETAAGSLAATVLFPASPGPRPAVVIVAGSGRQSRSALLPLAEQLAQAGVVALVYDKRTSGYSALSRSYSDLADDALVAVRVLQDRPDVDARRVGVLGVSEGGWVAPVAAGRAPDDVAFVILASAPNTTPLQQVAWLADSGLRGLRAPRTARRFVSTALTTARGAVRYLDYDPAAPLGAIRQPILALYGAADSAIPTYDAQQNLLRWTDGAAGVTVQSFEAADHGLRGRDGQLLPGPSSSTARWVLGLPGSAVPPTGQALTGAPSGQRYRVPEVPPTPWPASLPVLGTGLGVVAAGAVTYVLGSRGSRRRAVQDPVWVGLHRRLRPAMLAALTAQLAPWGFLAAAGGLIATGSNSTVALPALWVGVRLAVVLAVVTAVDGVDGVVCAVGTGWRPTSTQALSLAGAGATVSAALLLAGGNGLSPAGW